MSDTIVVMDKGQYPADRPSGGHLQRAEERLRGGLHWGEQHPRRRNAGRLPGEVLRPQLPRAWTRALRPTRPVDVVIRPEDIDIVAAGAGPSAPAPSPPSPSRASITTPSSTFKGFKWLIQTTDYCPVDAVHRHPSQPGGHPCHAQERVLRPITATTAPTPQNTTN